MASATNVQELHEYLWSTRHRHDKLGMTQRKLASTLGIAPYSVWRIFEKMAACGMIEYTKTKKAQGSVRIKDPALFEWCARDPYGYPILEDSDE